MGQYDAYEGKTLVDANGNEFTVKGGSILDSKGNPYQAPAPDTSQDSSTWDDTKQDIKTGAVPWAARGVEDLLGTPGSMTSLAGWAMDKGANVIPAALGGNYIQKAGQKLENSNVAKNWGPEGWAKGGSVIPGGDQLVSGMGYDPNYQPTTSGGKFARTGIEFAPAVAASMLAGPEAALGTLARGTGAAIGSEALGQAVEAGTSENSPESNIARVVGALGGGHFGPRAVTPFPAANQLRASEAAQLQQDIKPYGGFLDAAQRTGSPTLRGLVPEKAGQAEANNQAVTQALLKSGNIPHKEGTPFNLTASNMQGQLNTDWSTARKNAGVIRDQTFNRNVAETTRDARASYPAGSKELQEFEDARTQVMKDPRGQKNLIGGQTPGQQRHGQLNAQNYLSMQKDFLKSDNQHVQQLASHLTDAAHRTVGAPWQGLDERQANLYRFKAGADAAGATGQTLDPRVIANATDRKGNPLRTSTPMGQMAGRAAEVMQPVPGAPSLLGESIPSVAGAIGSYFLPGATSGYEKAIAGSVVGSGATPALRRMQQALMRNKVVDKYLGNQTLVPGRDYSRALIPRNRSQRALAIAGPLDQRFIDTNNSNQ